MNAAWPRWIAVVAKRLVSGGRDTFMSQAALISDKRATFMSATELFLADV